MHKENLKLLQSQDMGKVQGILKSRLPRCANIYNVALKYERFPQELSFYNWGSLSCPDECWIIANYFRDGHGPDITISSPPECDMPLELKENLANGPFLDWNQPYTFSAIDRNYSRAIIDLNIHVKGNPVFIFPCNFYTMATEEAAKIEIDAKKLRPGIQVKPLEINQGVDFIMKTWWSQKPGSERHIRRIIERNESSGVWVDGNLVSAYTLSGSGAGLMSQAFTLKEFRKRGLGDLCARYFMKSLADAGCVPCCGSVMQEPIANAFHRSTGLVKSHVVDYIYFDGFNLYH